MKTLKDHIILYDAECPMCSLYTNAFVRSKMLDKDGRSAYQCSEAISQVDIKRAVNEIALINKKTGEVKYGVDSLIAVIANSFPVFKLLLKSTMLMWMARKMYSFISYNRRVIIPHDERKDPFVAQPEYKKGYRILYVIVTFLFTSFILSNYSALLMDIIPVADAYREYLICAGQVFFQAGIIAFVAPAVSPHYLGNMMTVSTAGALLLLPLVVVSRWVHISPEFAIVYFLAVALLMLLEHVRRMRLLRLDNTLSVTWVLYRLLILLWIV
jgi:predicted DCC family thiol-disulfide oxidoreductase YuxK